MRDFSVAPIDKDAEEAARRRWDSIAHPLHSLGRLEDLIVKIAGITGDAEVRIDRKALIVMCADNGIVEEGVTQTGQYVTRIVAENMAQGKSAASIMCRQAGADLFPVDVGIAGEAAGLLSRKVMRGTRNFCKEDAMTRGQAEEAIGTGMQIAQDLIAQGYRILATGEMGIGNTTTASAVCSALLGCDPEEVTGRGAGLDDVGLQRKIKAIRRGIACRQPDPDDVTDVLSKVGGLDIAGLCGVFLAGAHAGIPVVIDGAISAAAALAATRYCPEALQSMLSSHVSKEPIFGRIMKELDLEPVIRADMCLGEGTGAVALFPLLDMAAAVYHEMGTFENSHITPYRELDASGKWRQEP